MECARRLQLVFPTAAFPPEARGPIAALSIFTLLYANAVVADDPIAPLDGMKLRPTNVAWMSDEAAQHTDPASREAWAAAATSSTQVARRRVRELHEQRWGVPYAPLHADNYRETIRDDVWRKQWAPVGAVRHDNRLPTTSSAAAWAATESFAALFNPNLHGAELALTIATWQSAHFGPGAMLKLSHAQAAANAADTVGVTLPDGNLRTLTTGTASTIMKGVVEDWATTRLEQPLVLVLSEPGAKLVVAEAAQLSALGISLDVSAVLPDAIIADIGTDPVQFWLIEVVATDGPVSELRKTELTVWATSQGIPVDDCRFLSAFASRHQSAFRKRVSELATGTYAWFANEPNHELAWYEI